LTVSGLGIGISAIAILAGRSGRPPSPDLAAQIKKSLPGFFSVTVKSLFSSYADFAAMCVVTATLEEYFGMRSAKG
jgi:hypothetical protein